VNRPRLTYANVVATLALVLAVGGASAFAATQLAKNSVGTKQLKNNAVTGAKVKNGSLSGADIGGAVSRANSAASADSAASATSAQRAGDADKLGGLPASAFQAGGSVQRIDWSVSGCGVSGCAAPLLDTNGFSVDALCAKSINGEVTVTADVPAVTTIWQFGKFSSGAEIFEEFQASGLLNLFGYEGTTKLLQIRAILRTSQHTLTLELAVSQNNNGACSVAGTALST
jgi:hypothetical protein